jgi:hypothetical protein
MMSQGAEASSGGGRNPVAGKVVAVADERSNALVISAPAALLATIEDTLDKLDRQVNDVGELRVFRLQNADSSELAEQLMQLFPDETSSSNSKNEFEPFFFGGPGGPGTGTSSAADGTSQHMKKMGKVLAVPDARTSSIIVTASKSLMPQIAHMVALLDSDRGKREVVSYFDLRSADPHDISQNLQDLFNRVTVRSQNNQNSFLSQNNPLAQRQTQNQQSTTGNTTGFGSSSGNTRGSSGQ